MKQCKKCLEHKDDTEFRKYSTYTSGACKSCERDYHTTYLRAKRTDVPLYHREKLIEVELCFCGRCKSVKSLENFRTSTRTKTGYEGTCKECKALLQRAARLELHYGISYGQYLGLLTQQNYVCAICSSSLSDKICVDHDHSNGAIRGLLCDSCNRGIGLLKDSSEILNKALAYLKAGSCKIPLNGGHPGVGNPVLNPLGTEENA